MCLAIPGQIVKIEKSTAKVKYPGEERKVLLDPNIQVELGDYVMVQMGCVIQKVSEKQAQDSWDEWEKVGLT